MPKIVDHTQRRLHIASIAARLIAHQGLENTSIRQIAREAGYSKGIVEHYFDSKDELISCALDWINDSYKKRIDQFVGGLEGLQAIKARIRKTLPLDDISRDEWKVRLRFWSLATIDSRQQQIQAQRYGLAREAFLEAIKQAKALGQLRAEVKPQRAANRILFTLVGASISALHSPGIATEAELRRLPGELIASL